MTGKYAMLEQYLRNMFASEGEVTLTFERIEQILKDHLPALALHDRAWWGTQKQGARPHTIGGWMVDAVDLDQKWVRLVRQ